MAGAVVAAVIAENEWRASDLEKASDEMGQDLMRAIRAVGIIKRFFRRRKHLQRLHYKNLYQRLQFEHDLLRGLGRFFIQILIFCLLVPVMLDPHSNKLCLPRKHCKLMLLIPPKNTLYAQLIAPAIYMNMR